MEIQPTHLRRFGFLEGTPNMIKNRTNSAARVKMPMTVQTANSPCVAPDQSLMSRLNINIAEGEKKQGDENQDSRQISTVSHESGNLNFRTGGEGRPANRTLNMPAVNIIRHVNNIAAGWATAFAFHIATLLPKTT
jgi:hypothetical protein